MREKRLSSVVNYEIREENKCIEDLEKEKLLEIVLLSRLHACSTPYLVESAEKNVSQILKRPEWEVYYCPN